MILLCIMCWMAPACILGWGLIRLMRWLGRLCIRACGELGPTCICVYRERGGGPYMTEWDEREDNPECLYHHPKEAK